MNWKAFWSVFLQKYENYRRSSGTETEENVDENNYEEQHVLWLKYRWALILKVVTPIVYISFLCLA